MTKKYGKGHNPRPFSDYRQYHHNFDEIPNFGFKPKWQQPDLKTSKHPDHLDELMSALRGNKMVAYKVNDGAKLSDFGLSKNNPRLDALFKKYNLDNSCKNLYIWEVVEKMHNYRPF